MIATDRLQAERIATGGKNVHTVAREYGRFGYGVPVAQSTTYSLETHPSADVDDDDIVANVANISTNDGSQAATLRAWQDAQLDEANKELKAFRSAIGQMFLALRNYVPRQIEFDELSTVD